MVEDQATFICGHPKSGTSLLRGMLDSHPQLIVFPEETKFFRRVLPAIRRLGREEMIRAVEDQILHVFRWNATAPSATQAGFLDRDYSYLDYQKVLACYRERAAGWAEDPANLLSAAILAYGEVSGRLGAGTRRWVEKSPYNERFADRVFASWPEARCLHVVRDPRDNYASYKRKHPEWSPEIFAESWRRSTLQGWKNQSRFGPDRYRLIRYEDLVLRTEELIAEIVRFLGIENAETLRVPTRDGRAWMGNSMFGDAFTGISRKPLGRHTEALAEDLRRGIEKQLDSEMGRLSYELTRPLTSTERWGARAGRARRVWTSLRTAWRAVRLPWPRTKRSRQAHRG